MTNGRVRGRGSKKGVAGILWSFAVAIALLMVLAVFSAPSAQAIGAQAKSPVQESPDSSAAASATPTGGSPVAPTTGSSVQELQAQLQSEFLDWYHANSASLPLLNAVNEKVIFSKWAATPAARAGLQELGQLETTQTGSSPSPETIVTASSNPAASSGNPIPAEQPQAAIPSGPTPVSNCFGGTPCTGPDGTTAGSGTTCVISSFTETAGDFLYVAINYLAGTDLISSVSDGGVDSFSFVGGEFATSQSVAFYDVSSENGGPVTITVTLSTSEFGSCEAGQLSAGTMVGVVGAGGNSNSYSDTTVSVTNAASHEPSLLLAFFGSTRPSGPWESPLPAGSWIDGGFVETGYNPGTNAELIAYDDSSSGTATITETTENSGYDIYLSGIAVEFYAGPAPVSSCFGGGSCTGPDGTFDGSGTTCVISSFSETAGDFMYVAINYLGSTNVISSVTAGSVTASYIGGEFATSASVAFYDIPSEAGGTVTITVTLTASEFGSCRAGQLSAGTMVGIVGHGGNTNSDSYATLGVTNAASHEPSLLLALFGSTRPSGPWEAPLPSGSWVTGAFLLTGYNPGANSELIAYDDSSSGTATITETTENSGYDIYLSGIAIEFYFPSVWKVMVNINYLQDCVLGICVTYGESDNINVYFGGSFAANFITDWGDSGWAVDVAALLIAIAVGYESPILGAVTGFLIAAGYTYLSNELTTIEGDTYYPNGGANGGYLWFDTDSWNYYPAIVDLADTLEVNAYTGSSWPNFVPDVPWLAYGGFSGPYWADIYSTACAAWTASFGSGWVVEGT